MIEIDSLGKSQRLKGVRVGVLGGGITGLTAAFYLLRQGADVTVIESRPQIGGLATYFDFGPFYWDKFYHCILTSDLPLQKLIEDLELTSDMSWTETKTGFFTDNKLYSMSSTLEFLKFPPLTLWEKCRLAAGILYASRIKDGKVLEGIPVIEWLIKIFGKANYKKMWSPLLKCKLGACREEASAAFIWATIFRIYSTRERTSSQREKLGYVRGGYRTVFQRMLDKIVEMGGTVLTNLPVQQVRSDDMGGVDLYTANDRMRFDYVIATVPNSIFAQMVPQLSSDYVKKLRSIKYLGMVCATLVLKRKLSPFYVMNLTDESVPFTGVIEMTNLISLQETRGRHLVYLPKYTAPGDPLFDASDENVWELFYSNLKKIIPDLNPSDVERRFIFRERLVQPVPVLHYSDVVPAMQTSIPGLLLANTTQIINSTLNNNEMVKIARRAVETILEQRSSETQLKEDAERHLEALVSEA